MKTNERRFGILLCLLTIVFSTATRAAAENYYVDSVNGNDGYSGTSTDTPWKNLTEVNSRTFAAGDQILLKSGSVWTGQQLFPRGSGASGNPIVVDKYGTGALPAIQTQGAFPASVYLFNQKHWEFRNFEITNYTPNSPSLRRGVYIEARDYGTVDHIYLRNLYIHGVTGDISDKDNGGIFFEIDGVATQTKFNDILIDGCTISNVDRTGISNQSSWADRTETDNSAWVPSTNVVISNNIISSTGGNGLIWRASLAPKIEHNTFANCADAETGNAMFVFNNDNAKIQYNEAYGTVFNTGDLDAAGFDADYKSKGTIIQYNYAHDNELGGIVAPCAGGSNSSFNTGVQIKYNILQNNLRQAFRFSGCLEGARIYNNTTFFKSTISDVIIIRFKDWGGYPNGTKFYNNIFFHNGANSTYEFAGSTNTVFDYNLFYGINNSTNEPYDAHKLTSSPSLVNVGSGVNGINTVDGYKLKPGSPAIDSGITISDSGGKDYFGNAVPYNTTTDRGANEYHP